MEETNQNNIVAFIPLRGDSKSIPLKNIKELAGKPLAFWAIEAALDCPLIDKVFVSTDSEIIRNKVSEIKNKKLEIITRSPETATDSASTESAMLEFAQNHYFNRIVLIQATSPLLESKHLEEGIRKYLQNNYDSLLSMVRQKRFIWQEQGLEARPVNYNYLERPMRQQFEGFLVENGAFYIISREKLLETKCRLFGKVGAYEMPEETYFELDEKSDWIIMEQFLKNKEKNKNVFRDSKKPYLIAEIGINHNGDINIAKKLISAASGCQWDCVKFQKRDPDLCVPEHQKNQPKSTPWGEMTYLEYKKRMEFGKEEYDQIDRYCRESGIDWAASVWDIPSLRFILNYDIPFIKIPSAKITELELVEEVAKSKKPVVLSTGMSTIEEIDRAVEILKKHNAQYILFHCNSTYPASNEELNLNCIKSLKERYKCEIGYSGHEYGLEPSVCAVAFGANIIERHITLDHNMWGTDQSSSLEVHAMDLLRKRIRGVKDSLGSGEKIVTEKEKEIRKKLRGY